MSMDLWGTVNMNALTEERGYLVAELGERCTLLNLILMFKQHFFLPPFVVSTEFFMHSTHMRIKKPFDEALNMMSE